MKTSESNLLRNLRRAIRNGNGPAAKHYTQRLVREVLWNGGLCSYCLKSLENEPIYANNHFPCLLLMAPKGWGHLSLSAQEYSPAPSAPQPQPPAPQAKCFCHSGQVCKVCNPAEIAFYESLKALP